MSLLKTKCLHQDNVRCHSFPSLKRASRKFRTWLQVFPSIQPYEHDSQCCSCRRRLARPVTGAIIPSSCLTFSLLSLHIRSIFCNCNIYFYTSEMCIIAYVYWQLCEFDMEGLPLLVIDFVWCRAKLVFEEDIVCSTQNNLSCWSWVRCVIIMIVVHTTTHQI